MADWKQIYEDKFNESAKGYDEQKKQYEDAMASEAAALQKNKDTAMANAGKDFESASQQAYIARTMTEKNMPQRLAAQGITGGMTETTNANIFRDFLNSKNAANTAYSKAKTDLENNYMSSSAELKSNWTQKMASLDAQRQAQALEQARFAYQIAVEEEARRKQEEEERRKREEEEAARRAAASRGSKPSTKPKSKPEPEEKKPPKSVKLYEGGKYVGYTSYDNYMKNPNHYRKYSGVKYIY